MITYTSKLEDDSFVITSTIIVPNSPNTTLINIIIKPFISPTIMFVSTIIIVYSVIVYTHYFKLYF